MRAGSVNGASMARVSQELNTAALLAANTPTSEGDVYH
jgi:hypothetical protein